MVRIRDFAAQHIFIVLRGRYRFSLAVLSGPHDQKLADLSSNYLT